MACGFTRSIVHSHHTPGFILRGAMWRKLKKSKRISQKCQLTQNACLEGFRALDLTGHGGQRTELFIKAIKLVRQTLPEVLLWNGKSLL